MNKLVQALINDYAKDLENGLSIEEQKQILAKYAKEEGYTVERKEQKGEEL